MTMMLRGAILLCGLLLLWQAVVFAFGLPPYILPAPLKVFSAWIHYSPVILQQTLITLTEAVLGLLFASLLGVCSALCMALFRPVRFWMLPILLISQAIPTFAVAPLLVLWLGYGMSSKIMVTVLVLFFPVTSAFYDGLRRTEPAWLDMATVMGASRMRTLWFIRAPAALPNLASGLRVATAFAPIGAVIGEWVGASRGLGFMMLNANARLQIDVMFGCLFTLVIMSLLLYALVDQLLRLVVPWQKTV
ncbi:MAG TPA: ABC transporter permease [Gammaproteobacteria bacterium]|nr:ABC transporter permease [Gammaproteobacteria bacterium]